MCRNLVVGGILLVTSSPPSGENATRRISGRTCTSQCPRSEDGYLYASPMTPAKKQQEHSRDVLPFPSSLSLSFSFARTLSLTFSLSLAKLSRSFLEGCRPRELSANSSSTGSRDRFETPFGVAFSDFYGAFLMVLLLFSRSLARYFYRCVLLRISRFRAHVNVHQRRSM